MGIILNDEQRGLALGDIIAIVGDAFFADSRDNGQGWRRLRAAP